VTRVLDLGCGNGVKTSQLMDEFSVVAADLPLVSTPPQLPFVVCDIESSNDLPDIQGGMVISADVVEHLARPEQLLAKIKRCRRCFGHALGRSDRG
jgi:2-polyprenyl-3-methyl-5-hydroxy-6-metoxy-1,4-benzoquinol methylase